IASSLAPLNRPVTIGGVDIRKIAIVAIVVAALCLGLLQLLLTRTSVGLQMRAAAMDFRTARLLGVRANRVIGGAVLVSGLLAAVVAVLLTVQTPLVTPDFALRDTIVVLAGVLAVPVPEKPAIMPNLASFLRDRTVGNVSSLALAALAGAVFALVVGLALMRLSGLAAGIATFAVLEITHNVLRYYEKIGPGLNTFSSVPETTGLRQAAIGALIAIGVAFPYQRSRSGRLLRATREDAAAATAVGISVYRQRLGAFV